MTIAPPIELSRLKNPPSKLYLSGRAELLTRRKIAIVGSRKALPYTKQSTQTLASKLKAAGFAVVSGGAYGADCAAHLGAYPDTIAVLANSLDILYPKINAKLLSDISQNGLLLSEYAPTTPPTKYSFIDRNRIVVGLCEALVIAQADIASGSMSSAAAARKMGIPIYVLPHRLNESSGTAALVKSGLADVIEDFDEFVRALKPDFGAIEESADEFLEFARKNPDLNLCIAKFGDKVYEYELSGKITIANLRVSVL